MAMTCSLRSAGITPASTLLRGSPPLTGASVLSASRLEPLAPFPLASPTPRPASGASANSAGGLAGADAHGQQLAAAVGAGNKTPRAYLSTNTAGSSINARDRIGRGPWV